MAKPHQRAIALILALVFLGTVVVSGIAVIWQIFEDNQEPTEQQASEQLTEQQPEGDMLQGAKLEDFDPVAKVDELQIIDLEKGDGEEAKAGATVTAHYTGALAKDGTIFQSSHDMGEPVEFGLDQVIKGWGEGVPGMKVGGKRRLVIPAAKAYGEQSPSADIPPNSDLVFDIEITAVKNP